MAKKTSKKAAKPAAKKAAAKASKPAAKSSSKFAAKPAKKVAPKAAKSAPKGTSKVAGKAKAGVKAGAKATAKSVAKTNTKAAPKADAKKVASKKVESAKVDPKKAAGKGAAGKGTPAPAPAPVTGKKGKVKTPKGVFVSAVPAHMTRLLPLGPTGQPTGNASGHSSGKHTFKPLIPSGPKAASIRPLGAQSPEPEMPEVQKVKSPYGKRDLEKFKQLLLKKRAELVGDVSQIEEGTLGQSSGALSNNPQHMADAGSDTYDTTLALDLAAADRKLIREIDAALARIANGTFGVCEITGKPINPERLDELPWARYSIEAAREMERRSMRV
ncbi:MAG: TraR/DksA family transcriptional regulator [Phycisphaerales bacterium]